MTKIASELKKTVLPTPDLSGTLFMIDPQYDGPLSTNYRFYWESSKGDVYYLTSVKPYTMNQEIMDKVTSLCVEAIKKICEAKNI